MTTLDDLSSHQRQTALELIEMAASWAGSEVQASDWFTSQPLPSFGGQTAADLVRAGRSDAVKEYLARIDAGGFS